MSSVLSVHDIDDHERVVLWRKACSAAIAELPEMGPRRIAALIADQTPEVAWQALAESRQLPQDFEKPSGLKLVNKWRQLARKVDPFDVLTKYRQWGVDVCSSFDAEYPAVLCRDQWAPSIIFWKGALSATQQPMVALVGTRRCTPEGRETAARFGAELSEAGISVVSGLALGIDGAAHRGALNAAFGAPPIGVVGNGLDRPYPRRHADLWREVGERGLLLSESALGISPEPWRFPARNRIIAALADVVVVVESHDVGGSLITANEALERGVTVMAVPGSIRNPAAKGCNLLLSEGMAPACSVADILGELSRDSQRAVDATLSAARRPPVVQPSPKDRGLLEAMGYEPVSVNDLMMQSGLAFAEVATSLARLEQIGWVAGCDGWWRRVQPSAVDNDAGQE